MNKERKYDALRNIVCKIMFKVSYDDLPNQDYTKDVFVARKLLANRKEMITKATDDIWNLMTKDPQNQSPSNGG